MKTHDIVKQDPIRKILARIYGSGRGAVFTPKDFLDLAGPETVRQALGRLTRGGKIRRLLRGVYDYPAFSKMLQALASPDPHAIGRAIARTHGWTILPAGETALNLLGLSTQVPARWEYFRRTIQTVCMGWRDAYFQAPGKSGNDDSFGADRSAGSGFKDIGTGTNRRPRDGGAAQAVRCPRTRPCGARSAVCDSMGV